MQDRPNELRSPKRILTFLEAIICEWEEAARFCEQTVQGVQSGAFVSSGEQQAKRYRAIIAEIKEVMEQIRKD